MLSSRELLLKNYYGVPNGTKLREFWSKEYACLQVKSPKLPVKRLWNMLNLVPLYGVPRFPRRRKDAKWSKTADSVERLAYRKEEKNMKIFLVNQKWCTPKGVEKRVCSMISGNSRVNFNQISRIVDRTGL